jgi:2-polyprenyl-3-methyl-5-hydroxy-6-metoxy-1,4-benzoquinol methylase
MPTMGPLDAGHKQRLDKFGDTYLIPDPGQRMDFLVGREIRDRVMRWVRGPEILEMGAGDGRWTVEIIQRFGHSSVVDGSRKLLENLKTAHGDKLTCHECFFEDFVPPGGARFQTVIATHILEHVHEPVAVLQRSQQWLAPGGRMILVVPNATSLHRRLGVKMGHLKTVYDFSERDYALGHQRIYDMETLKSHALEAGYRIVHAQGFQLKILPFAMMADFPEPLFKALFDIGDELPPEMTSDIGLVLEVGQQS